MFDFFKGFGVTFSTMFKKVVTEEYPEDFPPPAPRYHGRHQLNRHPDGLEKCIGCELCAEEPDPWAAFARFLRDALSVQDPGGPLLPLIGGRLPASDDVADAAGRLRAALDDLVAPAHRAGVLRADFTSADIPLLLEHLTA